MLGPIAIATFCHASFPLAPPAGFEAVAGSAEPAASSPGLEDDRRGNGFPVAGKGTRERVPWIVRALEPAEIDVLDVRVGAASVGFPGEYPQDVHWHHDAGE